MLLVDNGELKNIVPMSFYNPFFHRGAIRRKEDFHGRQVEVAQILGLLRNGQSVSIVGPRRIGKSSLLLHLCRKSTRKSSGLQSPKSIFALIDCQELGGSPPEEVYEAFLAGLLEAASASSLTFEQVEQPGSYRSLDRTLRNITKAGLSIVILLDEFELLAANRQLTPHFFARLRGLTTKYGIAFLTASQRPLFAITADEHILSSPFFNIFVSLSLGLFSVEEATNLLTQRLIGTKISFTEDLCQYLISLVGPHPFFLHVAAYHAFQAIVDGNPLNTSDDFAYLDAAIEIESESHFRYLWQNLSLDEQYCLATTEGPVDILRQLEQQCLIEATNDGHTFTSEILPRFVRRQRVKNLIQSGPFVIDIEKRRVHAGGQEFGLTNSQFDLLVRLGQDAGKVVPSEELETAVWGDALIDDPDRLKTLVKRLRRAVEPYSKWVISERGIGYTLRQPEG
jgi:hypothetical protein